MSNSARTLAATLAFATAVSSLASGASAMPVADALAIKNAVPERVESVQWRGGWGWGGVAAGFIAGAVVGSALTAPYYYGYGPYYPGPYYVAPPGPVYYGPPAPVYGAPVAGDAVAYCRQRFKSYDPATGTYLGFDGLRHPCP